MLGKIAKATTVNGLSVAGLLRLYTGYAWDGKEHPVATAMTVILLCLIAYFYFDDIRSLFKDRPKRFDFESDKLKNYMHKWVSRTGRTTIFSRDMTWARQSDTKKVLCRKASNGDLTVLVERETDLTNELKAAGATIVPYGHLGHVPKSRFTIVGFEQRGARVAIGAPIKDKHVVEEFQAGAHALFDVTEDLVKFLIKSGSVKP